MKAVLSAILMGLVAYAPGFSLAEEPMRTVSLTTLKAHLEAAGFEVFAHEDENDRPQLLVSPPDGSQEFAMKMLDCAPDGVVFYNRACSSFEYRVYLTPGFPIADKVYDKWNANVGHSRAFVLDGYTRLAWRVSVTGVTWDYIDATLAIWRHELAEYLDHLDASLLDG